MEIMIKQDKDGKVKLKTDQPLSIDQVMDLLMTASLAALNGFADQIENKEHRQRIKGLLYDNFNEAASAVLMEFMPDNELRPDLTEQAILEKEDEIMKRYIKEHEKQKQKKQ